MKEAPDRLEQKCITPGQWLIEGWDVYRVRDIMDSRNSWWMAKFHGAIFSRHYLEDIRDEIHRRNHGG